MAVLAAGLDGNPVLKYIDLSRNMISADGIRVLVKSDCLLQTICLVDMRLDDEGVKLE